MKNRRHHQKREKKGIKVTYISSPMKVKTCASNFRALVQKLTGKYSNVAEATFVEEAHYENDDYELMISSWNSLSYFFKDVHAGLHSYLLSYKRAD